MKSKITKIQKILMKGISIFIIAIFMLSSLAILKSFAAVINDDVSTGSGIGEESTDVDYIGSEDSENLYEALQKDIEALKNQLMILNSKFNYENYVQQIDENKTIEISEEVELRALAIYVAQGNSCENKTFKLTKNISLTDTIEWNPIGDNGNPFKGTLDGAGYTISGILIRTKQSYAGLIGYLDGGTVKNLTIANSNISIPPEVDNKILNDLVDTETVSYSYLGAFAGYANEATIINCQNKTNVSGGNIVGGIAGMAKNTNIKYCSNAGKIEAYRTAGGICGTYNVNSDDNIVKYTETNEVPVYKKMIYKCKNAGNIYAVISNAGGISGTLRNYGVISYCVNEGEVSNAKSTFKVYVKAQESSVLTPQNAGGIVGVALADMVDEKTCEIVEFSLNKNKVDGYLDIGGIAGQLGGYGLKKNNKVYVRFCINEKEFKYEDYKDKQNVGELAGRAGVKDSMMSAFAGCSYVNYKKRNNIEDHKTTTNEIRAYGFAGDLRPFVSNDSTAYNDELNFKTKTDEVFSKIKDTTAPSLGEIEIENSGNSQLFAIKGDVLKITIPFNESININRILPTINNNATYVGLNEDGNALILKYTVKGNETEETDITLNGYVYDTFGNRKDLEDINILLKDYIKIITSSSNSIMLTKNHVTYTISGYVFGKDGNLYFNNNNNINVNVKFSGKVTNDPTVKEVPILGIGQSGVIKYFPGYDQGKYNTNSSEVTYTITDFQEGQITGFCLKTDNDIFIGSENIGKLGQKNTAVNISNMYADLTAPTLTLSTSVNNEKESGIYNVGEDILIKATTSEAIDLENSVLPEINVNFSTSGLGKYNYQGENATTGNAKYIDTITNSDGTVTYRYRYTIKEGDEGRIELGYANDITIKDIAGNSTTYTTTTKVDASEIYADTTAPILKITANIPYKYDFNKDGWVNREDILLLGKYISNAITDTQIKAEIEQYGDVDGNGVINVIDCNELKKILNNQVNNTNEDIIQYTFTWSEKVVGFEKEDITVNGGTKGKLSEQIDNEDGTYSYTMNITNSVASGNIGDLQVIVEEGTCTDLVAINNVRQENNITIDKVKPTFTSYEVKKETGKIIIEATFSEEISDASRLIPNLTIGGKEYRGTWEEVEIDDDNKVKFVYNISGADGGKVEASLAGTVKDKAGNDSETLNIAIENDITIEQTVIKNGNDTYSFEKGNTPISDFTKPTYFVKGNTITVTKYTGTEVDVDGEKQVKIVTTKYTYTITEDIDLTHMKYMNLVEPADGQETGTAEFATTSSAGSIDITDANIYFDTTAPIVTTQVNANNPKTGLYTTGEEFTIIATSSEVIQTLNTIPEIAVKFNGKTGIFNSGKAQYVETRTNEDGTISWVYRYVVSEGDEGKISLSYINSLTLKDLAGNSRTLTSLNAKENIFGLNGIQVDATVPTVKITTKDVIDITNKDTIEYTFTWSEEVTGFIADDITVNGGTKGSLSSPKYNGDGTVSYTMNITNSVASGNTGSVQVIIEKGACQDTVGHENVRTESVITVDKKAPILISLEGYATSTINVAHDVDSVKEWYKVGDTVKIVATFSENIKSSKEVPILALQFRESGNAKGPVSLGIIDGNKITYTYTISAKDMGTLSVKGFSGAVKDAAGNETIVTKRALDGDTVIADTLAPRLVGLTAIVPDFEYDELLEDPEDSKRYGLESKTRKNNTITVIAEYSENIYKLQSNTVNNITSDTAPVLKLKFGSGATRTATFDEIENNKIYYTYNICSVDNGILAITSLTGTVSDIAGNTYTTNTSFPTLVKYEKSIKEENKIDNITADTTNPIFTLTATAIDKDDNGNTITGNSSDYRKGSIITITAKTNEYVYKNDNKILTIFTKETAPTLNISFATSGTGVGTCTNVEYTNNQTIFTYTYEVKENDNGTLNLNIAASKVYDIALNGNNVKTQAISGIIADTVRPYYEDQPGIEYVNGGYKVTFNENLYYLKENNEVTSFGDLNNAPLLKFEGQETEYKPSISNNVITYAGNYINAKPYLGASRLCDKAGNLYAYYDQKAPELLNNTLVVTSPVTGTYKAGEEITIVATFSEKITGTSPVLKLKFGDVVAKGNVSSGIINENTIAYTYTIADGDNGILAIESYTGTGLKDLSDNSWVAPNSVTLTGSTITADTIAPKVTITSDVEITNKDIVKYTFTWSEIVTEFTADGIEVMNGSKGAFKAIDADENGYASKYTLEVDTTGEGRQIVKVGANVCTDRAGNQNVERVTYNNVVIDYTKPTVRAKVNGGNFVIDTDSKKSTLKETLVVNEEVSKFEYIWSKETTMPETGLTSINPSDIQINSDIKLETQVSETGTYYLYMKVTDLAGNTFIGRTNGFIVNNSNITLTPNKTTATNEDVTVAVSYGEGLTQDRKAGIQGKTQSADSTKVIIEENGTVYAEATDIAGNKVFATLEVANIDRIAPKATIRYATNDDESVTATITFDEEAIVTNNGGQTTYKFTENGEFTFEFADSVGNKGTALAKVTSINKKEPEPTEPEPSEPENPPVEEDKTAPEITFNYTTTTVTVGTMMGATITTNEDAIIEYNWNNSNWITIDKYARSQKVVRTPVVAGTYTLYVKATDRASNTSSVSELTFTVLKAGEDVSEPEVIFNDLTTIQKDGVKYVKVSPSYTLDNLTDKIDKDALLGKKPEYTKLASNNKLKTGSEITIDGTIKYIIIVNGDVNCDGKVDFLNDIVMINNYRIGISRNLRDIQIFAGDINNSGAIEFISDIVAMNNYRLGRIKVL